MNQQLDLVLHTYDLELTIDEQTQIQDTICYYCDSNQEWMSSSEDGNKEHKIADQILNLPFSSHHTETITFTSDQIYCINHALNQKEELWSGDNEGFKSHACQLKRSQTAFKTYYQTECTLNKYGPHYEYCEMMLKKDRLKWLDKAI